MVVSDRAKMVGRTHWGHRGHYRWCPCRHCRPNNDTRAQRRRDRRIGRQQAHDDT